MRPCRTILTLFFAPLAFGCLVGIAIANSWLTAMEDAQRERRRREEERVTRDTENIRLPFSSSRRPPMGASTPATRRTGTEQDDYTTMELRYFIFDAAQNGAAIEWIADGGASVNVRN